MKLKIFLSSLVFLGLWLGGYAYVALTSPTKAHIVAENSATQPMQISSEIQVLFGDYSLYLKNGHTAQLSNYTPEMQMLISDRRAYYDEFFSIGLHIHLLQIESIFNFDEVQVETQNNGSIKMGIQEVVTLTGKPKISSAEEYPLIQAAYWAQNQTNDVQVKDALQQYIENMTEGVNETLQDGVKIEFILRHEVVLQNKNNHLIFLRDSFTDKNNDNLEGSDHVTWDTYGFVRYKPDLTRMPDYIIYNTSIEELGKMLLSDYSNAYGGKSFTTTAESYNRQNAKTYINTYTSNPNKYCSGTSVPQDKTKYNSSYVAQEACVDCTNYVSQAIKAGGYKTDTSWYPYSYAWINTNGLKDYLLYIKEIGVWYSNLASLQVGDIAFTDNYGHVVMVGAVSPHRYSGHTSDRKNHSWNDSLIRYMHILNKPGVPTPGLHDN